MFRPTLHFMCGESQVITNGGGGAWATRVFVIYTGGARLFLKEEPASVFIFGEPALLGNDFFSGFFRRAYGLGFPLF